ncbi:MAG: twitch domain-containing radical SAM protein [Oligoflexia bacterium]|nr:twitch domain-containing radical SAM protein [Oligoflexia bacterium]
MKYSDKTFCPLPWIHLLIGETGNLQVCCRSHVSENQGILRDKNKSPLQVGETSVEEVRNSELLKELRLSMLKGEAHPTCVRCLTEEKISMQNSFRLSQQRLWEKDFTFESAKKVTQKDGAIDAKESPLLSVDLTLGNKCNLKCRMCRPETSDYWYEDHYKIWGKDSFFSVDGKEFKIIQNEKNQWRIENGHYSWIDQTSTWEEINRALKNCLYIYITGGEPLIIEKHYELLEKLVEEKRADKIDLEYNTNLTVLPQKLFSAWKHFKSIVLHVSLDGVGKVNDYIRHPSKWNHIERMIHKLDQTVNDKFYLSFTSTIQIYNILDIPNLIKWKLSSNFQHINGTESAPLFSFKTLNNPKFLNVQSLPGDVKTEVAKILRNSYPSLKKHCFENESNLRKGHYLMDKAEEAIEGLINFMHLKDSSCHFKKFLFYTRKLDAIRFEKFETACPELFKLLQKYFNRKVNIA